MKRNSVNFYIIVLLSLYVLNTNGQTGTSLGTTNSTGDLKPVQDNAYQTTGFNSDYVSSGPILIIDKKTLFISNLNYNAENKNTYFWAGVGLPSPNDTLVADENNSTNPLRSYKEQNIYLQLPKNLTTDEIDYIAVWSAEDKTDLGHIMLYGNASYDIRKNVPEALGYHNKTRDNKTIFRVPFCCGVNEIRSNGTCRPAETDLKHDLIVFDSNETHIDPDRRLENIEFVSYKYFPECNQAGSVRIRVKNEILGFIYNTSLLFYMDASYYGMLSHGSFCVLFPNNKEQEFVMCVDNTPDTASANVQRLYIPCLIISTICFIGSAVVYIFILKPRDVHRKCFLGYSIGMIVTFVSLICLQTVNNACIFIGGLFMFSMICSFVWLACLCIDLIFVVKPSWASYLKDDNRIYIYLAISFFVPVIILGASLIPDGVPDVPKSFIKIYSGTDTCDFGDVKEAAFFVPIGILICVSVVGLAYTSHYINKHKDSEDFDWRRNKSRYKFMLRSCLLVWITTFIWLIEAVASEIIMGSGIQFAIDLIEALQGIFVTIIFVLHKYIRKEIYNVMNRKKYKMQQNATLQELRTFNKPNTASENDTCVRTKDTKQ